jgi:hypothetical protein
MAKIMATGSAFNDQQLMDVFLNHGLTAGVEMLQKRADAQAKYADAHNKIVENQAIESATREFLASPEAKGMTQQQIADQIKLIRNPYGATSQYDPQSLHNRAMLMAAGYRDEAMKNLPWGVTGSQVRAQIEREAAGIDPATANADPTVRNYLGAQKRTTEERRLGTIQANMLSRTTAAVNDANSVIQTSRLVPRGTFIPTNVMDMTVKSFSSDPNLQRYYVAIQSFINTYSGAINPTGASRVFDKQHAYDLINRYASQGSVEAAVQMMVQEMSNAANSTGDVEYLLNAVQANPDKPIGELLIKRAQERGLPITGFTGGGVPTAGGGTPAAPAGADPYAGFSAVEH